MKGRDFSEDISEWEQIQHPSTSTDKYSPKSMKPVSVAWTTGMVMGDDAEDGHSSSFPPNQNEVLQVNPVEHRVPDNSSPSLLLPLSSNSSNDEESGSVPLQSDSSQPQRNEPRRLLNLSVLSSVFIRQAHSICNYAVYARKFWPIISLAGIAAAVIYIKMQTWRRRAYQQTIDHLRFLLQEKDEKIRQLLLRIAQIHEALSVPRKVAVLRIRR